MYYLVAFSCVGLFEKSIDYLITPSYPFPVLPLLSGPGNLTEDTTDLAGHIAPFGQDQRWIRTWSIEGKQKSWEGQ